MTSATATEIREHICAALCDIGGACERLRELADADLRPAVVADGREDIATWLNQAATALQRAACIAELGN